MMKTMTVVSKTSRRVGQMTFPTSARVSWMNFNGLVRAMPVFPVSSIPGQIRARIADYKENRQQRIDAEIAAIRDYVQGIDLTLLTDAEVLEIQTDIAGGDRDQVMVVIDGTPSS